MLSDGSKCWCWGVSLLVSSVIVLMLRRPEAATNNSAPVSPTWDFSLGKIRRRLGVGGKIVTIADCKNLLRTYFMSIYNFCHMPCDIGQWFNDIYVLSKISSKYHRSKKLVIFANEMMVSLVSWEVCIFWILRRTVFRCRGNLSQTNPSFNPTKHTEALKLWQQLVFHHMYDCSAVLSFTSEIKTN